MASHFSQTLGLVEWETPLIETHVGRVIDIDKDRIELAA
jgi:hypothetical protein